MSGRPSPIYCTFYRFAYDATSRHHDMGSPYHRHAATSFLLFIIIVESSLASDITAMMFENRITLLNNYTWSEFGSVIARGDCMS